MMNRQLTDHKLNGLNDALKIEVLDEAGHGGASHNYMISCDGGAVPVHIAFQNGPIQDHGVNGISNEALIAIVIDRLRGFQSGKFACRDNDNALARLEESLAWLQKRTRERVAKGVEGTSNA